MNLDKEQVETVLRNHGRSYTVQRVVSMEYVTALPKGENYLSIIYRITLQVTLGNGRPAKKSLIYKVVPQEKGKTELVKNMGVFKNEAMMYTTVLREMEMLMDEFGDTNDALWCQLIYHEPYTALLLEDLKASGFRMTRRQDCLDLDHALLVLRSLGRFHAMAKVLETRGIISKDDSKPYSLVSDRNLIKHFMYYGLQTLAKAMEEHWGPEWHDVAQKLKIPCHVLQDKMVELGKVDETRFNCLNHGDCWSNNMMFKYDWQNRPYTMRFVDYQITAYKPPSFDLSYFLISSVPWNLRSTHQDYLLDTYHSSLMSSLDLYGYEGFRPSREGLNATLDEGLPAAIFGLVIIRAAILLENPDDLDLDRIMKTGATEGLNETIYGDAYKKSSSQDILWLSEKLSKIF